MPSRTRRSFVPAGRGRPQRRQLVWATDSLTATSIAAGAKLNQRDLLANLETPGAGILGATVIRTHSAWTFSWSTTDTAPALTVGYIVDDAPTVTNLDPSTAFSDEWMLLVSLTPGNINRQMILNGTTLYGGHEIDLRSKRKLHQLNVKYFLAATNVGTAAVSVACFTRTLLALP
jgi:hypothetical protein